MGKEIGQSMPDIPSVLSLSNICWKWQY
jgi:hypothetical protein